jgi:hypothetical protein
LIGNECANTPVATHCISGRHVLATKRHVLKNRKICWKLCSYGTGSLWGDGGKSRKNLVAIVVVTSRKQTKELYRLSLQWRGIVLCARSIQTKFIGFHLTECHISLSSGCLFAFLPFALLHYEASRCSRLINGTYQPVLSLGMRPPILEVPVSTLGRKRTNAHFLSSVLCCALSTSGRGGLQGCEMLRIPHCLDNRLTDGCAVVSPTHQSRSTLHKQYFLLPALISVRG